MIKIVTDSTADLLSVEGIPFASVPLQIVTAEREFTDDATLDTAEMLRYLKQYKGKSGSSCPNLQSWLDAFGDAEEIFCVTITSGLSGSFSSAESAAAEYTAQHPERRVSVIDSLSTGPENALIILELKRLIDTGLPFAEVDREIRLYQRSTHLIFALESLHNLASNGRVSPLVAKVAGFLGIRIIGKASNAGILEITNRSPGAARALSDVIANMKANGYRGGRVRIHHADNLRAAGRLAELIKASFSDAEPIVSEARGLCSFYAESGGLLIGFEGKDKFSE